MLLKLEAWLSTGFGRISMGFLLVVGSCALESHLNQYGQTKMFVVVESLVCGLELGKVLLGLESEPLLSATEERCA